ncbi:MAG: hypothetical protein OXU79_02605 [Gemmatimonadota bacterium]|nr:hypothetical protein [Gemmatimonadota bacterium]
MARGRLYLETPLHAQGSGHAGRRRNPAATRACRQPAGFSVP